MRGVVGTAKRYKEGNCKGGQSPPGAVETREKANTKEHKGLEKKTKERIRIASVG